MKVTADMLARAVALPDGKLVRLLRKWQKEYDVDPALFGIDAGDAASIRHALAQADADALDRLNDLLLHTKERKRPWKNSKTCRTKDRI